MIDIRNNSAKKRSCKVIWVFLILCCAAYIHAAGAFAATSHTVDEAMEWCAGKVGKTVGGGQCVDFIRAYYEYLGANASSGNGQDYTWNTLPSGWTRVEGGTPQRGDILVYLGKEGDPLASREGHVAIFESTYATYHQNFHGQYVSLVTDCAYNKFRNDYWGYIRPNFVDPIVSFDTYSVEETTTVNIRVGVWLDNPKAKTLTSIGMQCGSDKNTAREAIVGGNVNWTRPYLAYNTNPYFGELSSGRTYYIRYFVIVDGERYYSDWIEATTARDVVNFDTYSIESLYESDCYISVWLDNPDAKTLSSIGVECGKNINNLSSAVLAENVTWTRSNQKVWLSRALGYLESNARYYARFYTQIDDKIHYSDWYVIDVPSGGISFDTYSVSDVSSNSAVVSVWTSNPTAYTITEIGLISGKSKTLTAREKIVENVAWTRFHLSYNLSDYFGELDPSSTYFVRYYLKIDEKTFYSDWMTVNTANAEQYIVNYDANGGALGPSQQTKIHGQPLIISETIPILAGSRFLGWATYASAKVPTVYPGDVWEQDSDCTFYAVWMTPDFVLPADSTTIEAEAFEGGDFSCVMLSVKTTTIAENAFANCPKLSYIYIPTSTVSIHDNAFGNKENLVICGIPGTSIEEFAQDHGFEFVKIQ